MNIESYRQILTKYWGFSSFKPLQEDIIRSVTEGRDTLGLMKDQVNRLNELEIKSIAIHSGMTGEEIDNALENCIFGDYKFLYISPERISTRIFQARVARLNLLLVAIDEAHCISQWGYDFRPSYLKIASLREFISEKVPFLALTASATPQVIDDIMKKLAFREKIVLKTSFNRKNISYLVRKVDDKGTYLIKTPVSYTHLRAHETVLDLVCRLLLEK